MVEPPKSKAVFAKYGGMIGALPRNIKIFKNILSGTFCEISLHINIVTF